MENRHGLVVRRVRSAGDWDRRTRYGDEPLAGLPPRRVTIGGDKGYETRDFVKTFRT